MTIECRIHEILAERELVRHPFYRRWESGELERRELAEYGTQYEHFERQLAPTLTSVLAMMEPGLARDVVQMNLDDELGQPMAHADLLQSFLAAVGSVPAPPTPATRILQTLYEQAPGEGVDFAIGVITAYEIQSSPIAQTKSESLRQRYGMDSDETVFWDVHAALETQHAKWLLEAIAEFDRDTVLAGIHASRDAWWDFLSERGANQRVSESLLV